MSTKNKLAKQPVDKGARFWAILSEKAPRNARVCKNTLRLLVAFSSQPRLKLARLLRCKIQANKRFCCYNVAALTMLFSAGMVAEENFYQQHAIGWHWYNEKIIAKSIKKTQEKKEGVSSAVDPTQEMAAVRAIIERALNRAILNPTTENIASYLTLQNKISNQSTQFANVWQKVLLGHPELNYSLVQPTNNIAKQIYLDNYEEKESQVITQFFKQRGLFFFYSSGCPYCQKFAPIVKSFAARHGIPVIPVTLDGESLPTFPNSRTDLGQAKKFKVTVTPALFAVNPYTNKAVPIAYGFISESDLRQRILDIATDFKSNL